MRGCRRSLSTFFLLSFQIKCGILLLKHGAPHVLKQCEICCHQENLCLFSSNDVKGKNLQTTTFKYLYVEYVFFLPE